ncbi:hypothetical protein MCEMSE15_01394 [Fimbriimonadaceae bacterium]
MEIGNSGDRRLNHLFAYLDFSTTESDWEGEAFAYFTIRINAFSSLCRLEPGLRVSKVPSPRVRLTLDAPIEVSDSTKEIEVVSMNRRYVFATEFPTVGMYPADVVDMVGDLHVVLSETERMTRAVRVILDGQHERFTYGDQLGFWGRRAGLPNYMFSPKPDLEDDEILELIDADNLLPIVPH